MSARVTSPKRRSPLYTQYGFNIAARSALFRLSYAEAGLSCDAEIGLGRSVGYSSQLKPVKPEQYYFFQLTNNSIFLRQRIVVEFQVQCLELSKNPGILNFASSRRLHACSALGGPRAPRRSVFVRQELPETTTPC